MSDAEYERSVKSDQDPSEILRFSEMKFPGEICTPGGFKMTCDKILRKKINRSVIDLLFKAF